MSRINALPNWMLPDSIPSVYDTQSGSYQEMVAKVYGAMKELQLDHNKFAEEINKSITEFTESTNQDISKFKEDITKIMHDYIMMIDTKITMLDTEVTNEVQDFINQAIAEGKIVITTSYDDSNENLNIVGGA